MINLRDIFGIIMGVIFLVALFSVALHLGNALVSQRITCSGLMQEGYTSYADIAAHEDCKISKSGFFTPYSEVYNETCVSEKKDIEEFGRYCVWGSIGWLTLVAFVGVCMIILMLIGILFSRFIGGQKA